MHSNGAYRFFTLAFLGMVFFSFYSHSLLGQTTHDIFHHLTTVDGLSNNKIAAVIQDKEGFYWVATQNGLNRFDGTSFKLFLHNESDSTSLPHNYCTALCEDSRGDIWVGTYSGLSRYIRSKGYFQNFHFHTSKRNQAPSNRIMSLTYDGEHTIWISCTGIWKYDLDSEQLKQLKGDSLAPCAPTVVQQLKHMVYDQDSRGLWFSNEDRIIFYDAGSGQFFCNQHNPHHWKIFDVAEPAALTMDRTNKVWFRDIKTKELCAFNPAENTIWHSGKKIEQGINVMQSDPQGRIWIMYWFEPAEIYDPATGLTEKDLFLYPSPFSVLDSRVTSLFVDEKQNYWISGFKGISVYSGKHQFYKRYALPEVDNGKEIKSLGMNGFAQTVPGQLWIASQKGLYYFDFGRNQLFPFDLQYKNKAITSIMADDQNLWLCVLGHLVKLDPRTKKIIQDFNIELDIHDMNKDESGILWATTWNCGLIRVDPKTREIQYFKHDELDSLSLSTDFVVMGMVDENQFWVGLNAGFGFSSIDIHSKKITHYTSLGDKTDMNAGTITAIVHNGLDYWIGTHGAGVYKFMPGNENFINFRQEHGLASNFINRIISDQHQNLWIATADGLSFYNSTTHTLQLLDIDFLFPSSEYVNCGLKGQEGKIYFINEQDIIEIDPEAYHPEATFPAMVLSGFKVFDKEVNLPEKQRSIELNYNQNFFSFDFSGIDIMHAGKIKYSYLLEGFDPAWRMTSGPAHATYTNVPPGQYKFKIKATNQEGQWSDVLISKAIIIHPPFWQQWWFIVLAVLFVGAVAYLIHYNRVQQVKKIYSVRTQISRDLHDDIGASLSSIHIYSSIAESEMGDRPEKAKEFLQRINQNSRQVMEEISDLVWSNSASNQDHHSLAERIKNYGYDLLAQKNIKCQYVVDPQIEKQLTRPEARRNILMIIKEAMNNISKYSQAQHAAVHLYLENARLMISIADDGLGFNVKNKSGGHGLENMKQRAESLAGNFNVTSETGRGTTIECNIPIANISD